MSGTTMLFQHLYNGENVDFGQLFMDAALPIIKVFILCALGAVAAHANIFDPSVRKNVSVLVRKKGHRS